jgi:uncharacterized protein
MPGPESFPPRQDGLQSAGALRFPPVDTLLLTSAYARQTFKIEVVRPPPASDGAAPLAVLYATDGNLTFDVLKGLVRALQLSRAPEANFILVSIGYPGATPSAGVALRARDFTFADFPRYLHPSALWADTLTVEPGSKDFGGGEDFRRFLQEELVPRIDSAYGTQRSRRMYFGHSSGGTFGLYCLFSAPELFRDHLIVSPALCFHGKDAQGKAHEHNDFALRKIEELISRGVAFDGNRLYLAVGAEEEFDPAAARWRFTSGFFRLAALLQEAVLPGLSLTTEIFPGEGHMSAWPVAFMHGIRDMLATDARRATCRART